MAGYLLLFGAGLIAGSLNVIAGGGSFLTLPILMFLGLPPGVANGTNRVGILLQNVGAVWSFQRHGVLDWRSVLWAAVPSIPGAALGVWLALLVSDQAFKRILALLMVTVSLWTLWSKRPAVAGGSTTGPASPSSRRLAGVGAAFFLIGIYGGFVQAGVGFLILAATTAAGLDLVRGNAVKVLTVLCFTALSLTLFAWQGRVDWPVGLVLAAGTTLGGLIGARLTVLKGHRWVRGVVTATMILFALKLWFSS
jgi:uncharacterized membrane protein YfcA